MKNKISFTSVLKSKASVSSKMMNGSSQYSMDSQSRHGHQRLMDIYQQYESYPEQDYTLDFSSMSRNFTNSNGRSRNSSMNMMSRSKNGVCNEDPQMSLQMWIERQKKGGNSNYESFNSNNNMGNNTSMSINKINNNNIFMMKQPPQSQQKSFRETLTLQQQQQQQQRNVNNITSNNFNPTSTKNNSIYYQQQQQSQQLQQSQCSQDLNNNQYVMMEQQKWGKKSPINFKSQQQQQSQQLIMMNSKQLNTQMEDSSNNYNNNNYINNNINNTNTQSSTPQQLLAQQQLKSKTHYPSQLQDNDYNRLKQEFEKLKNEKITQLCMQAKKSIKKDKLKEIISKALENIYEDIEQMAERMVEEKRRDRNNKNTIINSTKNMDNMIKRVSQQQQQQQQDSQSMLISGQYNLPQSQQQQQIQFQQLQQNNNNNNDTQYYQQQSQQLQTDREQQQRRQQQIRNMIKGYISGIQQAKSQHENRFTNMMGNNNISKQSGENQQQHSFNNNINNNDHIINNTFNNHNNQQQQHEQMDAVGYSFANNNINNNSNIINNMNMMMGCQHSFNRDIGGECSGVFYHHYNNNGNNGYNNNYDGNVQQNNNTYNNNNIKPQVYQPQQSFSHQQQQQHFNHQQQHYQQQQHIQHIHKQQQQQQPHQQHISIPNIQQVKSDCGEDNYYQQGYQNQNNYQQHQVQNQHQVQCSQEIQMQIKNKLYNKNRNLQMLNEMGDNNNIKNIESVHYQPPVKEERKIQFNNYVGIGNQSNARDSFDNSKKELFKNFQKSHESIDNYIVTGENNTTSNNNKSITSSNNNIYNINKASFSSMLMRPQTNNYNTTTITTKQQQIPTKQHPITNTSTQHRFISKTFNSYLSGQMRGEYGQAMVTAKQSVNMSMNTSLPYINSGNNNLNQQSLIMTSPKYQQQNMINNSISQNNHHHQLQSKSNKFSMSLVNSPMTKIDEIMLREQQEQQKRRSSNSQSPSSYAVSSPLNGGNVGESVNNGQISQFNTNGIGQYQYACAQSIKNDNIKSNNSILDIQPLRLSPTHNDNIINTNISISINKQPHTSNPSTIAKLTQSIENNQPYVMTISQQHSIKNNINNTNTITSGRNFLQSLHEKQSIEIQLSPSGTQKQENECKQSFAAQTFRPNVGNSGGFESNKMSKHVSPKHINTINNINNVNSISGSNNSNSNKLSITKITLRSSDRNNNSNVTSPKVISLMAANNNNNLVQKQQQKTTTITQFVTPANDTKVDGKQNIFQKVTIRASINNSNSSNGNNIIDMNNQSHALKESIKFTDNINNIKNHQTNKSFQQQQQYQSSKQNNNTMNNSKPALITQRKEPLLKLAKNLTNSINQQQSLTTSINNTNNLNVKKSIGESIRNKVHQPGMMIMSKNITLTSQFPSISIKQSFNKFGNNVKQSIGNDSDMDFDLELD